MKYILLLLIVFITQFISAQTKLPVIKATSKNVSINDDGAYDKNVWNLSPQARPDVYTADRTRQTKWVTFYTDIDSIRVKVKPGGKYGFIILLNGKDSCYTQIESAIPPLNKQLSGTVTHDTIPFTINTQNAIVVKALLNNADTLLLHFDVGSFDFRFTQDAILHKTKLLPNQADVLAGTAKANYRKLNKVSSLQMGSMVWNTPDVGATLVTSTGMDGKFGWQLFEGKKVEIDYDNNILIVHSHLPKTLKGFSKMPLTFIRSFVCAKGTFIINHKKYSGDFLLDTGSDQAIILDSGWAAKQDFPKDLKLIKTATITDPRGVKYETKTVLAPALTINHFQLTDIPTVVLTGRSPLNFEINYLGNDLLKRFNMILDFEKDELYLKPNKLMRLPYKAANG